MWHPFKSLDIEEEEEEEIVDEEGNGHASDTFETAMSKLDELDTAISESRAATVKTTKSTIEMLSKVGG